jgi:hypothetical protein
MAKTKKAEPVRRRIDENCIITLVAEGNPKRPGSNSNTRFELYRSGMTVKEAKAAGLRATDIMNDSNEDHGFITLTKPDGTMEVPASKKARKAAAAAKRLRAARKAAKAAGEPLPPLPSAKKPKKPKKPKKVAKAAKKARSKKPKKDEPVADTTGETDDNPAAEAA